MKRNREGEEPVNVNVKNGVKSALAVPLILVVSMWGIYDAIRRTRAMFRWMVVSDPARRNNPYNCCQHSIPKSK